MSKISKTNKTKIRLDKFLSDCEVNSRKDARLLIWQGHIKVNGAVFKDPSAVIDIERDKIEFDDKKLLYSEFIYIMMNKPDGVLSASRDSHAETAIDLLPTEMKRKGFFPAGRLDKDSEGFLLITDDGVLSHNILSPKKHVEKVYYVEVEGVVDENDVKAFADGIELDDSDGCDSCKPAKLEILNSGETSTTLVTISEGKYHQIKRMFISLGKYVTYLKRISIAGITLDENLGLGECRLLTPDEIKQLKLKMEKNV